MDFTALLAQYSGKGKYGFNPIMKYGVLTYANMRGIREIDRTVELCKRDLAFIWLAQGTQPKRDTQTLEVYGCADCSGCEHKAQCLYKYNPEKDADKNKVMKINERWEELKEKSHTNIQSEKGILNRQIRSIQTEGHFGDVKENDDFRRFNHCTADKVYKEFMMYAIGKNINRYHRFLCNAIQKFEGKKGKM